MSDRSDTGPAQEPSDRGEAAWDAYWRRGGASGHALTDSAKADILDQFWTEAMTAALEQGETPRFAADLACGSGAVAAALARSSAAAGCAPEHLLCVDWSSTAAWAAAKRLGAGADGLAADLAALPLADGALDFIVSQYGLEYAGFPAFREVARVLAPGGRLIALVHDAGGGVAAECRRTHGLFDKVSRTNIVSLAKMAFEAGFAADRQASARAVFEEADMRLRPALAQFGALISAKDETTAMQFLRQVRRDLGVMYARRRAYAPEDVFAWLDNIGGEIIGYRTRMRSMLDAAKTASEIDKIAAVFGAAGFAVEAPQQVLTRPGGPSIGWRLSARKARAR